MPQLLASAPVLDALDDRVPATRRTGIVLVRTAGGTQADDEPDTLPYPALSVGRQPARSARTLRSAGVVKSDGDEALPSSGGTRIVTSPLALARRVHVMPKAAPVSSLDPSLVEAIPESLAPDTDRSPPPDLAARADVEHASPAITLSIRPAGSPEDEVSATAPTVAFPAMSPETAILPPRPTAPSAPALDPWTAPRASGTYTIPSAPQARPAAAGIASGLLFFTLGVLFTLALGFVASKIAPGVRAHLDSAVHAAHGLVAGAAAR